MRGVLTALNFAQVNSRRMRLITDAPDPGSFCGAAKLGAKQGDVFARLHDKRLLAVECKVAVEVFKKLFKRETMYAKFASQLRYCLIRGDAVWHFTADPNKPAGKRISIHELDPATYFPIHDEDDPEKLIGVHTIRSNQCTAIIESNFQMETLKNALDGSFSAPAARPQNRRAERAGCRGHKQGIKINHRGASDVLR